MAALMQLPEGVAFSSDENLVGARMLFVVVWVGLTAVIASFLTQPEDMEHLKKFLLRARPFAFGWQPVIRELNGPYRVEETSPRTLVSWGLVVAGVAGMLFGTGQLLLGPRPLGAAVVAASAVALLISALRIRRDTAGDHEETDFLREVEALDAAQARDQKPGGRA
jgi:peptidoglycan/LPS O-acetylase OafA/YrhL